MHSLSCQQCQQRKSKCDKGSPCSSCIKAGLHCVAVHRKRLPRGRSGKQTNGKPTALSQRLAQLENAVTQLQHAHVSRVTGVHTHENEQFSRHALVDEARVVAPDFWRNLNETMRDLRTVVELVNEDVHDEPIDTTEQSGLLLHAPQTHVPQLKTSTEDQSASSPLFGKTSVSPMMGSVLTERSQSRTFLLSTYRQRFDSVFKVLHWPTTASIIEGSGSSTRISPTATRVVEAAITFAAVCTLKSDEIEDREILLHDCRGDLERSLNEAAVFTTTSLVVLQAFVIYLAALRTCQANATQWTLLPVAIRLASAQGIPSTVTAAPPNLRDELKKRLWHCIGMLDLQSSFDRGSRPLLRADDFQPPLGVDDSQSKANARFGEPQDTIARLTEMTFPLLTYHAMICQHRLNDVSAFHAMASSMSRSDLSMAWHQRQLAVLTDFEQYTERLDTMCGEDPFERFTRAVAHESLLSMRLLLHRPLHKMPASMRLFAAGSDGFDVLQAATVVLQSAAFKADPEFQPWGWYSWTKWYALAIVLAELRSLRVWHDAAFESWEVACQSYQRYAQLVADAETGLLWKPIRRLMSKTQKSLDMQISRVPGSGSEGMKDSRFDAHHTDQPSGALEAADNQTVLWPASLELDPSHEIPKHPNGNETCGPDPNPPYGSGPPQDDDPMLWFHWDTFIEDMQNLDEHQDQDLFAGI